MTCEVGNDLLVKILRKGTITITTRMTLIKGQV